jgi:hypothetical protein
MNFLKLFVLFLLAFDPQIPFLPNGVGFTFLLFFALLPVVLYRVEQKQGALIFKHSAPLLFIFFISMAYMVGRLIFNQGENVIFVLSLFKAFFVFGSIFFYFVVFYKDGISDKFVAYIAVAYAANAIFNFISGTYPEHFVFFENFKSEVISDSLGANPYRNSFISSSGYFSIGTAYGLASLLIAYHIAKGKAINFFFSSAFVLICIAGFIAARTSFFAIAGAVFYIFINRSFYSLYLGVVSILVLSLVLLLPPLEPYVLWMQSFFVDFDTSSSASYLLNEMYFWPGMGVVLRGSGFVNDGTFIYTDAGYMQDIMFGGVVFLFIKLLFVVIFFAAVSRVSFLFAFLFCASVLAFHFKGLFVYNNAQGMAIFYFTYFYFCSRERASGISPWSRQKLRRFALV